MNIPLFITSIILLVIIIIILVLRINIDYTCDLVNDEKWAIMWYGRENRRYIKLFKIE